MKINREIGKSCRLHHQGRTIIHARNQREATACYLLQQGFLGYSSNLNRGDMFFGNVGGLRTGYMTLYSVRQILHKHYFTVAKIWQLKQIRAKYTFGKVLYGKCNYILFTSQLQQ